MLQKIYIKNYAIIDELTVEFDKNLNVITGETGAGKSIIMGALSLILGDRADTSVLINSEEKCSVEASFDTIKNEIFNSLLKKHELDAEHPTIIRREITASGKSRAFVNDTPVNLTILNELTSSLVDMHRQFDNRAIEQDNFAYDVVDALAKNQQRLVNYQEHYKQYRANIHQLEDLQNQVNTIQKEADYNQFLFDELDQIKFKENEIEDSETILKQLNNAENIKYGLSFTHQALEESEWAINGELKKISHQLQVITNVYPEAESILTRIDSCYHELRDIANEAELLIAAVDVDNEQLAQLQEKVDLGYRLLKKHGVLTTNALIEIYEKLKHQLSDSSTIEDRLLALSQTIEKQRLSLLVEAAEISGHRKETAPELAQKICELLRLVGMPNAIIQIGIDESKELNKYGKDDILLLFDANKSGKFVPVHKAASGGEISRIMLCIKTLTAEAMALPTLIFDEVDTGISGEAAKQVGILLRALSDYHQVLCITHQPQVAGKGTSHLYVYKTHTEEKVKTKVRKLSTDERVRLIAQMIGGEQPSEAALNNAKELLQ